MSSNLSDVLAQARGLGIAITLVSQYRNQLSSSVKIGIDANVRNKIVFGLNAGDAKEMAFMVIGLEAEDFMLLPRYHVYSTLMANGKQTGWVSGKTYPAEAVMYEASELRAISMKRYGKSAHLIEEEYLDLLRYNNLNDTEEDISANIGRSKTQRI